MLDLGAVPVSETEWLSKDGVDSFRVWRNRLFRKTLGDLYYGGYRIMHVSLDNARLVKEWLA